MAKKLSTYVKRAMQMLANPPLIRQSMLRRSRAASFKQRLDYDAVDRPHYGYGVWQAATQAKALGINRISVYEFGVAGGEGLICLERVAESVERETGIRIDVYGFDTGKGMPPPTDPRDLPFVWTTGLFRMRPRKLRARLKRAKLILGDIRQTLPRFLYRQYPAPVGFVAIDVDYYTSTMAAFDLLRATPEFLLPRVFLYFDDIIGANDLETCCEHVGELAAIRDFNAERPDRKIGMIHGLRHKRIIPAVWNDMMAVLYAFDHPRYNQYINCWKLKPGTTPHTELGEFVPTPPNNKHANGTNAEVRVVTRPRNNEQTLPPTTTRTGPS